MVGVPLSALYFYKAFDSDRACCKLYDEICVIRLNLCLVRRLASYDLTAFFTAVYDDVAALGVGKRSYRAESAEALVCPVTGVDVDMDGVKTEGAVVA